MPDQYNTNIRSDEEVNDLGEVAKNANEPNTELCSFDFRLSAMRHDCPDCIATKRT